MSRRTLALDDRLYAYVQETWLREPEILKRLRAETAGVPGAGIRSRPSKASSWHCWSN